MLYSLQLEKSFLGGLIQNPSIYTEIERFISEKCFYHEVHSIIFSCFKSCILNKESTDKIIIAQKIKNLNINFKDQIEIYDYLEAITFTQITQKAVIEAGQELASLWAKREIKDTLNRISNNIDKSASEPLSKVINECDKIYSEKIDSFEIEQEEPEDLFDKMFETIQERGNSPIDEVGMMTPYPEFNRLYGGLRGGNIYAIASRPAQGKSTFLNEMGAETAKLNNCKILFLDTEMSFNEVLFRQAASKSGVSMWALETGNFRKNKELLEKVNSTLKNLKNEYNFYHYHIGNKSIEEVSSLVRRWYINKVGRGNKCIVVYDYLKLTGEKVSNNWAEHQVMGEKVDKLKKLSEEYNFPLLTAIQLNRSGENSNKQISNIVDDGSAVAISDRLQWFTTYLGIFRRKTADEILLDTIQSGTHKMIEIKARHGGRDAVGHNDFILRTFPNGEKRYVKNYLNFSIDNFKVTELGSLKDAISRGQHIHTATSIPDSHNHTL